MHQLRDNVKVLNVAIETTTNRVRERNWSTIVESFGRERSKGNRAASYCKIVSRCET